MKRKIKPLIGAILGGVVGFFAGIAVTNVLTQPPEILSFTLPLVPGIYLAMIGWKSLAK